MTTSHNIFYPASTALSRDVIGIRIIQGVARQETVIRTCAMVDPGITFHLSGRAPCIERIVTRTRTYTNLPFLFLHGCRLEPSTMYFKEGPYITVQVALRPWALQTLFGANSSVITAAPLGAAAFGATTLEALLLHQDNPAGYSKAIENFLIGQLAKHGKRDALVEASIQYINEHLTSISVQQLAEHFGVSERHLQKRYALFIGCSPSKFIQIKRLSEALRLIRAGTYPKLADVAHALNYYDQAHFIRDVKAFSWLTPKAITQAVSDFRLDESGIAYIQ